MMVEEQTPLRKFAGTVEGPPHLVSPYIQTSVVVAARDVGEAYSRLMASGYTFAVTNGMLVLRETN